MTQVTEEGRRPGPAESWRRRTDWLVSKPWGVVGALAVLGLIIRHAWITTKPLAAGDWHWPARSRILEWSPWPSVWDSTLGFSGENRFLDAFRFPVYAVNGAIAAAGGSWTLIEKVVYFVPFAILLPVAGWLLAREILGPTRWTLVAPLLLVGNTYFLINGDGEVPLVLGEVISCLALVAFIRTMRRLSFKWAILTGLAVAVTAAFDIRPAYLTVLLVAGYLFVLAIAEPGWHLLGKRLLLGALAGAVFVGTQAFWLVPFLTYHGHPGLPTPRTPNFSIITLTHGIAGVAAGWSGGPPAALAEAPLNPMFMVLPLLAMIPLLRRKMLPELVWLALAAVICAFLAKTNTPPFGGVYNWMYLHVPGFRLFREGSKFFYPIAIAYAVLIPAAMSSMVEVGSRWRGRLRQTLRATLLVSGVLLVVITVSTVLVLERGQLGSTTQPVAQPPSFSEVSTLLNADRTPGGVLWFGSPVYTSSNDKEHRYVITSAAHAVDNLTGNVTPTAVNRRDVLQYFCGVVTDPFCYVNRSIFPYLAGVTGASYIVAPGGPDVGHLPRGTTRAWLRQQLSAMFGPPTALGAPSTQLLVWHINTTQPAIANYPAVALVESGPWSLSAVLPALQAMAIPAAYRQTFDRSDFPPAPASLKDAVPVIPHVNGGCWATAPAQVGVMAQTDSGAIGVTIAGDQKTLPLLTRSSRSGWGLYGPVSLPSGLTAISATAAQTPLGPCVQWSPLTAVAFGSHVQTAATTHASANGEHLKAAATAAPGPWTELRRLYDPGWRLHGHRPVSVGDGLFNLYNPAQPVTAAKGFGFTFSTLSWEHRGQAVTALTILAALGLIVLFARRERRVPLVPVPPVPLAGRIAPLVSILGIFFMGLTALATTLSWFGVPSIAPWTAVTPDPYALDVVFGSAALALLGLSLIVRLGEHLVSRVAVTVPAFSKARRRKAALITATSLFVAACGGGSHTANQALTNAQQAGAPSKAVVGESLDEARLAQQAKRPHACIADYTKALKAFPRLVSAYAGRAACYGSVDAAASVHDLDRALALSPGDPALLLQRAVADRRTGDLGAAEQDYRSAATAPAATAPEMLQAVDGLIALDQIDIATQVLRSAMERFPSSPLLQLGTYNLAIANGNQDAAGVALDQAGKNAVTTSDVVSVLSRRCSYQLTLQEYRAAVATCERTASLSSDASGAYDDLAAALAQQGQLQQAIVAMTSSIGSFQGSVGPNAQPAGVDGFGLAHLYEARGRLYVETHQIPLALADYQQALKAVPPKSPDFVARLKGDTAAAKRDI